MRQIDKHKILAIAKKKKKEKKLEAQTNQPLGTRKKIFKCNE